MTYPQLIAVLMTCGMVFSGITQASNTVTANASPSNGSNNNQISAIATSFLKTTDDQLKHPSQAYYFFLGMCSQGGLDPATLGRRIVENFNAFQKREPSPCGARPKAFSTGFPCKLNDFECYVDFLKKADRHFSKIEQYENSLLRYNQFLTFRHYTTSTHPRLNAPKGEYELLRAGSVLRTLDILRYAKQNPQEATRALETDIISLRKLLQQADTARFKSFMTTLLNRNVIALTYLHEQYRLPITRKINPITESEASIKLAVARDFSENYHTVYNLDAEALLRLLGGLNDAEMKNFIDSKRASGNTTHYYDRYMTTNDIATLYQQLLSISPLSTEWNFTVTNKINDLKDSYTRKYVRENQIAYNTMGFGIIRSATTELYMPFLKINRALVDLNKRINDFNTLDVNTARSPYKRY